MTQEHMPVLIVGAGGAGLTLSLLLHQQGISSLVIERRDTVSWYPRARNLNFRSLEVFRGLGLEKEVLAAGTRMSRMFHKQSLVATSEEELLDPVSLTEHPEEITLEPFVWYCPQSQLEPLLLEEARKRGCDIRYGTELVSFIQDEMGVTAMIKEHTTGKTYEVRSSYLLAADGAHSRVREALKVPVEGLGELPEYYIFVYFRAAWRELIQGHEADAIMIANEHVHGMFLVTDQDRGMFVITGAPGQEYTGERCKELILAALGKPDMAVEVVDIAHWQPIQRVARQFQEGHVFLVGDAAHTMPPKLGLGVNTAIQSAQNLAWKLAAVLKGVASPLLLTTYRTERHRVGQWASEQSLTGPAAALFEKEIGIVSQYHPERQISLMSLIIGYRYCSEAIFAEDAATSSRETELLGEQETQETPDTPELSGQPGTRVPHVWIERQRTSTLDLIDGRFVLLTGEDGGAWLEAAPLAAGRLGIELATRTIGSDAEERWQARMGISTQGALLVRPDGFVGWRSATLSGDPEQQLELALTRILCRDSE